MDKKKPEKLNNLLEKIKECIYRNGLKNREFDKEALANGCLERVTIVLRQGTSENSHWQEKPTQSKTDSSDYFGIAQEKYVFTKHAFARVRERKIDVPTALRILLLDVKKKTKPSSIKAIIAGNMLS